MPGYFLKIDSQSQREIACNSTRIKGRLGSFYSKNGPHCSSIDITQELVIKIKTWPHPRLTEPRLVA